MEAIARAVAVMLLPLLAFACIAMHATPMAALGALVGVVLLAVAFDAVGPRVARAWQTARRRVDSSERTPSARAADSERAIPHASTALLLAAPVVQGAALAYVLWLVAAMPRTPAWIGAMSIVLGLSAGTVGISAAHELVHRRGALARGVGQAFMLLVSYPHFRIVHLRVHHPYVGTPLDPGTSRRDEPLLRFIPRAFVLSWRSAWRVEAARLARVGVPAWRIENAVLRALAMQCAVYLVVLMAFGWIALCVFVAQGAVAIVLALAVDYTQHYGVVRGEASPGRLERLRADHAWSSDHASNRSTFNLGLHADHHLRPAVEYEQLDHDERSLQAPCGYPGLILLALVPPLWSRVMNPRLRD